MSNVFATNKDYVSRYIIYYISNSGMRISVIYVTLPAEGYFINGSMVREYCIELGTEWLKNLMLHLKLMVTLPRDNS